MSRRRFAGAAIGLAMAALFVLPLCGSSYLLFIELQGLAGYSRTAKKVIFYSQEPLEFMQKPSLGFDYVQRFSGPAGDFAILTLQGRLGWNAKEGRTFEPQLYNAYLKFKFRNVDAWVGHDRPKFGLESFLDSHAALIQPLSMKGFGFDRDWGVGIGHDTAAGSWGVSATTGSGYGLRFRGNYFLSGRASFGVLDQDNFTAGFSLGAGKILEVMGYDTMSDQPVNFAMAALDVTTFRDNIEQRFEIMGGKRGGSGAFAGFYRLGVGLFEERRLKLELQPLVIIIGGSPRFELAGGMTFLASADWTVRNMVVYDAAAKDFRFVFQVYFYKGLRF